MTTRLLHGDCRDILPTLADASVHCVVTSPPYFGLRDYQTGTWEGGDAACGHTFAGGNGQTQDRKAPGAAPSGVRPGADVWQCIKCGARRIDRQIGLEPDPETYLATMVAVFREVRRVLRPDGCCFVNMGDSYASQGGPVSYGSSDDFVGRAAIPNQARTASVGYKPKDLLMMPARLAIALQADGWFLRSMMPWLKRSAMPESVTDRPANAVEYVFLLTKSARYFFDAESVKRTSAPQTGGRSTAYIGAEFKDYHDGRSARLDAHHVSSRNFRNSDLFYDSLEDAPEPGPKGKGNARSFRGGGAYTQGRSHANGEAVERETHGNVPNGMPPTGVTPLGLICSDDGEPLALDVNPAAFSAAHFATFPPKLVEPLIRAGTSERGCCAACGAPWQRVVEKPKPPRSVYTERHAPTDELIYSGTRVDGVMLGSGQKLQDWRDANPVRTTGWTASCACAAAVVPCTVLDPFAGAGTTLLVADRLQRDAIGIELSDAYGSMATSRVVDDAPLLAWLEAAE